MWNLHSTQGSMRRLCHDNNDMPGHDVTLLTVCDGDVDAVWTYVRPGECHFNISRLERGRRRVVSLVLYISCNSPIVPLSPLIIQIHLCN